MTLSRRVVVTQRFFDDTSLSYLKSQNCEVSIVDLPPGKGDGDLTQQELVGVLTGAAGWVVGHARVTRALLEALPELKIISRRGVGYERVDAEAARELGKVVAIAAGGNDASVADHTIGLMLAVARRFREQQANMINGDWSILMGSDLDRKTVGIIGLGRIGKSVVKRLRGFEARILVHAPRPDRAFSDANPLEYVALTDLLERSDYITIHAPLTAETRFLIDERAMTLMKPGAFVINTARGGLVQDAHLLAALKSGKLGGAGLDVFVSESNADFKDVTDELIALPNVIATPHSGASTREGLDRTNMVASKSVVAVLNGGSPASQCIVVDGRVAAQQPSGPSRQG